MPPVALDGIMTSDVSGSWGYGAFFDITVNELIPIVVGAAVWGLCWTGRLFIMTRLDNKATVEIVNSGTCKYPEAMHLLRSLFFIAARLNCSLRASHIRGADNGLADGLSQKNRGFFLRTFHQAYPLPTQIPPMVVEVLPHTETGLDLDQLEQAVLFTSTTRYTEDLPVS